MLELHSQMALLKSKKEPADEPPPPPESMNTSKEDTCQIIRLPSRNKIHQRNHQAGLIWNHRSSRLNYVKICFAHIFYFMFEKYGKNNFLIEAPGRCHHDELLLHRQTQPTPPRHARRRCFRAGEARRLGGGDAKERRGGEKVENKDVRNSKRSDKELENKKLNY